LGVVVKFKVQVLVTYEVDADSVEKAYDIAYYNTEHPIFPDGVGGCVDDEIVLIEEVM
jgi:hypothetical protein